MGATVTKSRRADPEVPRKVILGVCFSPDEARELRELARERDVPISQLIRHATRRGLREDEPAR